MKIIAFYGKEEFRSTQNIWSDSPNNGKWLQTVSIKNLKKIAFAVEKFFKSYPKKAKYQENSPNHIAAELGMVSLFKFISKKTKETNPSDINGVTPLHIAAEKGHLKIVKYIAKKLDDKNPPNNDNSTPLHSAVIGGHIEIVKYLSGHLEDIITSRE